MQTERQMAANPHTNQTDLACRMLPSTSTIAIYYYNSGRKSVLFLPTHEGWNIEST